MSIRATANGVLLALLLTGSAGAGGVDHLVPVNPYPSKAHAEYVTRRNDVLGVEKLELDGDGHFVKDVLLVLIQEPFDPEILLAFQPDGTVTRVSPERNLWFLMRANDGFKGKAQLKRAKIQTVTIHLGAERSKRVVVLMEKLLRGARYPADDVEEVEDATVHEFRLGSRRMFGQATSEAIGPAKRLVDLAEAVARLDVRPDGGVGDDSEREIDRLCEDLESALAAR